MSNASLSNPERFAYDSRCSIVYDPIRREVTSAPTSGSTQSWWHGLVGVALGGVIGAAAGVATTWMGANHDDQVAQTARLESAYVEFLSLSKQIEVKYLVDEDDATETPPEFRDLYTSHSAVELVGSFEAVEQATLMFNRLRTATTASGDALEASTSAYRRAERSFVEVSGRSWGLLRWNRRTEFEMNAPVQRLGAHRPSSQGGSDAGGRASHQQQGSWLALRPLLPRI